MAPPSRADVQTEIVSFVKKGIELHKQRQFREAINKYKSALELAERHLGRNHQFVAGCLTALAEDYNEIGEYQRALTCLQRALEISAQTLGEKDYRNAMIYRSMSESAANLGRPDDAIQYAKKGLEILITTDKQDDPNLNVLLLLLSGQFVHKQDFANAEQTINKMLQLNSSDTGALNALGDLRFEQGRYDEAKSILEKCVAINKQEGNHPFSYVTVLTSLSNVEAALQNYDEAIGTIKEAKKISEKTLGQSHPEVADHWNDLGRAYAVMGNTDKQIECYAQALSIYKASLDQFHPRIVNTLINEGSAWLIGKNDAAKAKTYFEQALHIYEASGRQDDLDASRANQLLADAYSQLGDLTNAENHYKRSLDICESVLGNRHHTYFAWLYGSSSVELLRGDFAAAAVKLQNTHSNAGIGTHLLAWCYHQMGKRADAIELFRQDLKKRSEAFSRGILMSERSRLALQAQYASRLGPEAFVLPADEIGTYLLRTKGAVLDSICEERAALKVAESAKAKILSHKIATLRARIAQLGIQRGATADAEIDALVEQVAQAQSDLAKETRRSAFAQQTSPPEAIRVVDLLAENTAFVDIFRYDDPRISVSDPAASVCYGAIIYLPSSQRRVLGISLGNLQGKCVFANLGNAKQIDDAIRQWRSSVVSNEEESFMGANALIYEHVWKPIVAYLPDTVTNLYIAPDGELSFLSFAAVARDDGSFMVDSYRVAYVSSGRDLTRSTAPRQSDTLALFADPNFGVGKSESSSSSMVHRGFLPQIALDPLPGTRFEADALTKAATDASWSVSAHLGEDATEAAVIKTANPGILHLATHGFYLNSSAGSGSGARGMAVRPLDSNSSPTSTNFIDPMRASGIALSGAQQTLDNWAQGTAPQPSSDGVLTADEIAALDLTGTWLATLSACESGIGEARSGEGVFGMRRAFRIAGALNLLVTLWPVDDAVTAQIMAEYYRKAFETNDLLSSLSEVQSEWLRKTREEEGVVSAVRKAGAFVLAVMSNPHLREHDFGASKGIKSLSRNIYEADHLTRESATSVLSIDDARLKADAGDPHAQAILSIYYGLGYKVPRDLEKSAEHALKSASSGHPLGIFRLGEMREVGHGMDKDPVEAQTLKKTAMKGLLALTNDPYALTALGSFYLDGVTQSNDPISAALYYKSAAEAGYAPAQYSYAVCLMKGQGAQRDEEKASHYMKLAADQNYPPAVQGRHQ
jgi:tetratricopeptide (TPR) repeat protein